MRILYAQHLDPSLRQSYGKLFNRDIKQNIIDMTRVSIKSTLKFHMNDINATIGIDNSNYYDINLKNVKGVTLLERQDGFESSFWIYSMLVDDRDGFYQWMKECNIMVSQVHERNDKHTTVSKYRSILPILDSTIGKVVSIPNGWWVTKEQREYIVDCIKKGW